MPHPTAFLVSLAMALALVLAACGSDDDAGEAPIPSPTPTTPTATATPTATVTPTATPTATATVTPTATATLAPGLTIEVGPVRLTNLRLDPPSGVIAPRDQIRITADVESSFDGELRIFIAPLPDESLRCTSGGGNQAFTLGSGAYDRSIRPVDLRDGCPLPAEPVPVTGFEVRVFLPESNTRLGVASFDGDFTVDPALVALVDIDRARYRILSICQAISTVGLISENLLLEAVSPVSPHQIVGFQWWIDEGAVSGYHVQRGPNGEILEGEPDMLDTLGPGGVVTDETVLYSANDPNRTTPIPLRRAHARPSTACPQLTHHADAASDVTSFQGRWAHGVWQACPLPNAADGVELWLTDGGSLQVESTPSGLAATFIAFDGSELTLAGDGESSFVADGGILRGDLRMVPTDDPAARTQRVRFELSAGEVPCRSS